MKKVKILLSAVAVVAVVAISVGANARLNHVIYTHSTTDPVNVCNTPVAARSFVKSEAGLDRATTIQGNLCDKGTIFIVED